MVALVHRPLPDPGAVARSRGVHEQLVLDGQDSAGVDAQAGFPGHVQGLERPLPARERVRVSEFLVTRAPIVALGTAQELDGRRDLDRHPARVPPRRQPEPRTARAVAVAAALGRPEEPEPDGGRAGKVVQLPRLRELVTGVRAEPAGRDRRLPEGRRQLRGLVGRGRVQTGDRGRRHDAPLLAASLPFHPQNLGRGVVGERQGGCRVVRRRRRVLGVVSEEARRRIASGGLVPAGPDHQQIQALHEGLPVDRKIVGKVTVIVTVTVTVTVVAARIRQSIVPEERSGKLHAGLGLLVAGL
mmetsp:Transcript_1854/g.4830  ORF Transcript_1854/g.4830 Transcript_1854/m.4830 type:complete len:300 (+) Transcript_1854:588-1487(+)